MSRWVLGFVLGLALTGAAHASPSMQTTVEAALRPALRGGLEIVHVELPRGWSQIHHVDASIEGIPPDHAGTSFVRVSIKGHNDQPAQVGYVRVELAMAQQVVEVSRPMRAGETLDASALRSGSRVLRSDEHALSDAHAVVGRKLAHDLMPGQAIGAADLVAEAPVLRGTPVRVIAKRGAVSVVAAAMLEKSAVPGEETVARVVETKLLVTGRLIDRNTVLNEGGI